MALLRNFLSPNNLMFHYIDVYKPVNSYGSNYELVTQIQKIFANVPANVQPAMAEVIEEYKRKEMRITHSIFIVSRDIYEAINSQSTIAYNGQSYEVKGKVNALELDVVYRIDCERSEP